MLCEYSKFVKTKNKISVIDVFKMYLYFLQLNFNIVNRITGDQLEFNTTRKCVQCVLNPKIVR